LAFPSALHTPFARPADIEQCLVTDAESLAASRLEVVAALHNAGSQYPLMGRSDAALGVLACVALCHAANAYALLGDAHRQTHLLLAAFSLRANTDPASFVAPLPSIDCIPDSATFLRRLETIYRDLLWQTAPINLSPIPTPSLGIELLEYAALGLGQQMTLGLATSMPLVQEALHYRHFATLLLELGAAFAIPEDHPEVGIRDLATNIIIDTSEGNFAPLLRPRLDQLADLTEYFASMAARYTLAHDLGFLFQPSA
jgi:hypothetical protein